MNDELQNILKAQWDTLPKELQQAILAPDFSQKIVEVGTANKLHLDQVSKLEDETILLLVGITHPDEFVKFLSEHLHSDMALAEKVAHDIGVKIVVPVREAMQKVDFEKKEGTPILAATEPKPVATTPAPSMSPPAPIATPTPAPTPAVMPEPPKAPAASIISTPPVPPKITTPPSTPPAPAAPHPDVILSEPTISKTPTPPATATPAEEQPKNYTTDPYREPPVP